MLNVCMEDLLLMMDEQDCGDVSCLTIMTMQEKVSDNAPQFKCQRCGACCKLVGLSVIPEIKALAKENTDACRHLLPNNLCAIYETRPLLCRVDELYEQMKPELKNKQTREEWHRLNYDNCKLLRSLLGMQEPEVNKSRIDNKSSDTEQL